MMTMPVLFQTLNAKGIRLLIDGGRLKVDAPAGTLTAELRESLTHHRRALSEALGLPADDERAAIQWAESLAPAEASRVLVQAAAEWDAVVADDQKTLMEFQAFLAANKG